MSSDFALEFNQNDVKVLARKTLYHGFSSIEQLTLQHRLFETKAFSQPMQRELIHRPQAAGVLLYDSCQQKFALIEQFRVGAIADDNTPWQLEIVAGLIDGTDTPEQTVIREAYEEAGICINLVEPIFSFYPSAGGCDEIFHLFASNCKLPQQGAIFGLASEHENIRLHIFDYSALDTLLNSSHYLKNSPVIIALQWLKLKR